MTQRRDERAAKRKGANNLRRARGEETPQPVYFTQEDPIGLAGGMNLYGYAGGDPINFSDSMGLCAAAPDSVLVDITECVNGKERKGKAWADRVDDPATNAAVSSAIAGMSYSGANPNGSQALTELAGSVPPVYSIRTASTKGNPVLTAAGTMNGYLFIRSDVLSLVVSGNMNAWVPVPSGTSTMRVCTAIGHEGLHMTGMKHGNAMNAAQQGFVC